MVLGLEDCSPVESAAAAAAPASFQSCPTLCDPIDSSPLGSSVPGILRGVWPMCRAVRVCVWGEGGGVCVGGGGMHVVCGQRGRASQPGKGQRSVCVWVWCGVKGPACVCVCGGGGVCGVGGMGGWGGRDRPRDTARQRTTQCVCVCVCVRVRAGEGRGAAITDRYVHQSVECQYKSQFLVAEGKCMTWY